MLQDETQCGVVVVSLAEEMPVTETGELAEALRSELAVPLRLIVANALLEPVFTEPQRARLCELDAARSDTAVVRVGVRRAMRERIQLENLARLRQIGAPLCSLPYVFDDVDSPRASLDLGRRLLEGQSG
jgi:hypothetical protein